MVIDGHHGLRGDARSGEARVEIEEFFNAIDADDVE